LTVQCVAADVSAVRATLLRALLAHRLRAHQLETGPGLAEGQVSVTARVESGHVVDEDVEKIVAELAAVAGVAGTAWQVTRASPEA
jgi:hypothetical protein